MKKFTAGEWEVGSNGVIHAKTPTNPPNKYSRHSEIVYLDAHTEEHRANARLIEAAPLMYEKLQRVLYFIESFAPNDDLAAQIKELLRCIDDEEQGQYIYDRRSDVYKVPLSDGRIMLYKLSALQKIISEHAKMKELLKEIHKAREAESLAIGRQVRAQHAIEDFLESTETQS